MKIRRVSVRLLDPPSRSSARPETPRQRQRRELEAALEGAIEGAKAEADAAFQVTLEPDEKLAGVRTAFKRVKERVGATEVNFVTVGSAIYIARVPQRRGRRPKVSS